MTIGTSGWNTAGAAALVGGVAFFGQNGNYSVDPDNLYWDDTNKRLHIKKNGVNSYTGALNLSGNVNIWDLPASASKSEAPGYNTYCARGTEAIPSAVVDFDLVHQLVSFAYVGASPSYQEFASWTARVAGSTTNPGSEVYIGTKAEGGVLQDKWKFDKNGLFSVLGPLNGASNELHFAGALAGANPTIYSLGIDPNVYIEFKTKGTGGHLFKTNSTQMAFTIEHIANGVNYLTAFTGIAGSNARLAAQGSDINIGVTLANKGTATLRIDNNNTATTATAGVRTLPANPQDFLVVNINGTDRKIPYYAT